ncbi:homing endonuclease [Pectobacterium phage Arno162]|jgi:hypothetical protein|uniref:Homing endonuclease n=2 Tax=Arnovirus TaxID=3425109 RepID=A0A678ZK80_9CAUD|nr:homing endonuclease [Pectobacterium phage Arno162]AZV02331.1 homing endonuclease [Pectobacterium phage Arno18]
MQSLDILKENLIYNPKTGHFFWKKTLCSTAIAGRRAGHSAAHGYRAIQVCGKKVYEHDAAWLIINGEIPDGFEIDHKNLVKTDNRLCNLRLVSKAQNQHNRSMNKNNTSGIKGVSFCKQTGMYKARVTCKGKCIHVGRYKTIDEAEKAVKLKRNELHGEFSNHG